MANFNFAKYNAIKAAIIKKHTNKDGVCEWSAQRIAIAAKKAMEKDAVKAKTTPISELKLYASTEAKLVEAGLKTVEAVKSATDEVLRNAGLSDKAIAAVKKLVNGEGKTAEKPAKTTATPISELKLYRPTEAKLVNIGLNTVEAVKAATDEQLTQAGLSDRAVKAVRQLIA